MDDESKRLLREFSRDPRNPDVFKAVSEHLFFQGHWKEYVDVIARRAEILDDAMEAARLWAKAASIAEDKLRDLDRAEALFRSSLEAEREFRPALLGLRQILEKMDKWEDLSEVLLEEARLVSPLERPLLYLQAGRILETRVGDIPKAIETYRGLLAAQPGNIKAVEALENCFRALGRWEDLRELLEEILASDPSPEMQAKALFKLGKIYETRFADVVRAARCLEMVRELRPEVPSVYKDLERLYRGQKNWGALVRVLEAQGELNLPASERARCLKEAGEVLVEKMGDTTGAARLFSRAAELAPDLDEEDLPSPPTPEPEPQESELERRRRELTAAAEEAADPDRADRAVDLARLLIEEGDAPDDGALWLDRALAASPKGRELWRSIVALAAPAGRLAPVAAALETAADASQDAEEAAGLLVDLGDFSIHHLSDRARGIRAFQKALKRHPHDETAVLRLETHWEAMGHQEGLTSLYRWQAAQGKDEHVRSTARRKLTRVLARDASKTAEAAALLEASVLENPADADTVAEYVRLMTAAGNTGALLDVLKRALEADPEARPPRVRLAALLKDQGEFLRAADILEELLDRDPEDEDALLAYRETLEASHDFDRLAVLLAARARNLDSLEEKLAAHLELGALYRDKVRSLDEAVAAFEDALVIDPASDEAFDALEAIYEGSERWAEMAEILERRAAYSLDEEQTAGAYMRIGGLWAGKAGALAAAAAAYEKAATLAPTDPTPLRKLEEVYTGLQDSESLLRVLLALRESTADPEEAVRCLAKAGDLCLGPLKDPDRAGPLFREVLDVRPDHVPALRGLRRVCETTHDRAGVADAVLREAAVTEDPVSRARLYREGGLLLLDTDEEAAEHALREAIALESDDPEALEALEGIYEGRGEWGRFVGMAMIRLDSMEAGPERTARSLKVAGVLEELGRSEEALALFSSALKADPSNLEALAGVRRIAEGTQSYAEAAEALRREIQLAPPERAPELCRRLGQILESQLGDLDGALQAYREAASRTEGAPAFTPEIETVLVKLGREDEVVRLLEESAAGESGPGRAAALMRAGDLSLRRLFDASKAIELFQAALAADPASVPAREILKGLLTRQRRWTELIEVLETEGVTASEEGHADLLVELGLLHERFTGDLEQASGYLRQALARDPVHRAARTALARVQRRAGDAAGLADTLTAQYEDTEEPRAAAALAAELGALFEGPLADPQRAVDWYQNALSRSPGHPAALGALERLYERLHQWDDLVKVGESILRSEASDARKKAVSVRLGRLYEEEFRNLELALKCYKSALSFDPESLGALRGVQRVARAAKNFDACRKAFEREIRMGGDPARLALLHQGVGILLNNEGKHEEAIAHFGDASVLAPGNREILKELLQLYEKLERPGPLADALERWARLAPTGVEKAQTLLEAARVAEDTLKDADRALRLLQRANEADPENTEVLSFLGNLLFARGDYQAVVELLHQEIALASDREKKSRLLLRAAQIYEDPLADMYKAAECLQEAVRLNPQGGRGLKALKTLRRQFAPKGQAVEPGPGVHDLLSEAHRLQDKEPDRASGYYLAVLDRDPDNVPAIEGMVKISLAMGKVRQAAVWLSFQAGGLSEDAAAGPGEVGTAKPSVFFRLGKLIEEHLDDPGRAVEAYFRAWELAPALAEAAEGVLRLGPRAGMWEEYVQVRATGAANLEADEKLSVFLELATIEEEDLHNPEKAAGWIRAAMEEAPLDISVLNAAVRIFEKIGDMHSLAEALGKAHDVASIHGNATPDEAAEVGRIFSQKIHDSERAATWFGKALELAPGDAGLLREYREACVQAGRLREADRALLQEIEVAASPAAQGALHRERARLLSREMGDESEALRSLQEAARLVKPDFEILSRMESLAKRTGRWDDLAGVLERMAGLSDVDSEKADLFAQAGDIYWERLSDFARARKAYSEAVALNAKLEKPAQRLAQLCGKPF